MALSYEEKRNKDAQLVRRMAAKLKHDIESLDAQRRQTPPKTFLQYCTIRNFHNEIQGLISTIEDRFPPVADLLPEHIADWLIRAKLKAITSFVQISREFVREPPVTLKGSLTARDVLSMEHANFIEAREFFNKVLLEQALDDKTADELDRTLTTIEETLAILADLLDHSVNYLEEFG
jgi:hypothetical protein